MDRKVESRRPHAEPTVLVLGMGATGASCARHLAARGVVAAFVDTRATPPGTAAILEAMPGARIQTGAEPTALADSIERVLVSPGVAMDSPVLATARARGIPVLSDIDLFFGECRAPVVGVTGSNGKSTVTAMTGAALTAAGWSTGVGGNIGTPALDLLDTPREVYVLELSSFQLERSQPVPATVAVILNISPDHLDRHAGMTDYTAAKGRIYRACQRAVVNRDDVELAALVPAATPVTGFGLGEPGVGEFGIRSRRGTEHLACGETLLMPVADLSVVGRHNQANALAALALGAALGADLHGLVAGLKEFTGLPHRMETILAQGGVTWIDDSKATNVGAAIMSIASVADPLILIAGGDAKGADFQALTAALRDRESMAILLGQDRDRLAAALAGVCDTRLVDNMRDAVSLAARQARPGYTVLLAPACSSLDQFRDFSERGRAFAAAVEEVTG